MLRTMEIKDLVESTQRMWSENGLVHSDKLLLDTAALNTVVLTLRPQKEKPTRDRFAGGDKSFLPDSHGAGIRQFDL
jgi:hypothetical protein